MRSEAEIREQIAEADVQESEGTSSRWPGMTYEQGVSSGLRWAVGDTDDKPMED